MMKGYEQKKYPVATKRYVQWLELESDEEAIREYRRLHSEGVQWKEILFPLFACLYIRI